MFSSGYSTINTRLSIQGIKSLMNISRRVEVFPAPVLPLSTVMLGCVKFLNMVIKILVLSCFRYLIVYVAAQMLDCPTSKNSFIKELTLTCDSKEDCTLHLKHGQDQTENDSFLSYRVPVEVARRFMKNGNVDYKLMHERLYELGYGSRTRKNFIQNFHGMYWNCCTTLSNTTDVVSRIETFVDTIKREHRVSKVLYVCFNSFISKAFAKLIYPFARSKWGHVVCCMNSIPPLIHRSHFYDFRRCVYHVTFPLNFNNAVLDRDPCSRAVSRELYSSNYEYLVKQLNLFFDRCECKYFPKMDRTLRVDSGSNKTLFLITELSPDVLNELFIDVTIKKSVSIDVKRDLLNICHNK